MKTDIGIHFIITIFIWLVSWTAAIEISHIDLNNHPNKTDSELKCGKTFWWGSFAHCYDQEDCKVYGDCCRNSVHYVESEQTARNGVAGEVYDNVRYGCYRVKGMRTIALMIGNCPRDTDLEIRKKCEMGGGSSSNGDGGEDFASRYPVTDTDTGHVYRNVYCAWCHGERRRVVFWKPVFQCNRQDSPAAYTFLLEDASDRMQLYRDGFYEDYDNRTRLTCYLRLQRPPGAHALRPCGQFQADFGLVDGCPVGTTDDLAWACASRTYTVFVYKPALSRQLIFRNADCARCNGVIASHRSCEPSFNIRFFSHDGKYIMNIGSLFDIKSDRKFCASDELYDLPAAKCRNVIRDGLSTACRTYVALGPSEYDGRTIDNKTAYVYAYNRRVRHRNGSAGAAESGNVSLEFCTEDVDGLPLKPYEYSMSAYASFLTYVGIFGSSVSFVALIVHLTLFCWSAKPKNLPEKNLASLAVSLLLGYGSYLAIALRAVRPGANLPCLASALAMQFGFTAAFAWMFVMSADVWYVLYASTKKLRKAGGKRNGQFAAYSAFAWLAPVSLTAFAAVLQLSTLRVLPKLRPNFQHDCWFRNPWSLFALFVLPAGVIFAANCVSFVGAVRLIAKSNDDRLRTAVANPTAATVGRARKNLGIYVRLSLIMGLAWVFGLIGAITDNDGAWTAFTALSSLQGAFLFVAFNCKWATIRAFTVF